MNDDKTTCEKCGQRNVYGHTCSATFSSPIEQPTTEWSRVEAYFAVCSNCGGVSDLSIDGRKAEFSAGAHVYGHPDKCHKVVVKVVELPVIRENQVDQEWVERVRASSIQEIRKHGG